MISWALGSIDPIVIVMAWDNLSAKALTMNSFAGLGLFRLLPHAFSSPVINGTEAGTLYFGRSLFHTAALQLDLHEPQSLENGLQ